jgi:hypothetical protein
VFHDTLPAKKRIAAPLSGWLRVVIGIESSGANPDSVRRKHVRLTAVAALALAATIARNLTQESCSKNNILKNSCLRGHAILAVKFPDNSAA